jgi:hypothetical protein
MFKKLVLFSAVMTSLAGTSNAQSLPCATDEHYHELLAQYPELAIYEKQFETQMNRAYRTTAVVDTNTYDVPIVVHIVHDYGAENLSDDVVFDAVDYWAKVFMKQNGDTSAVIAPFVPYIGNPKIRLHLATIDPNGNPTKGIAKHFSYLTGAASDQAKYESWPNNKYINIWFIKAFGAASAGAAAYAYYPSSGAAMPYYDGVIGLASYINVQKTIPHELGHVLNLSHVWGSTNNPGVACGDDNVDDTPPTKGHTACTASTLYDVSCAAGYSKTYLSISGLVDSVVNYPDTVNTQNIMDYSYCELMFSKGQAVRMRNALTASVAGRNNLITASNLNSTGALMPRPELLPKAEFIVNKAQSAGLITDARNYFLTFNNEASFVFRNASWNDTISSVSWTFSNGATLPTSTSPTVVTNKFSVPGWVTVGLTATSNAGSNTITDNQAVYVADTTAINVSGGYNQNFASASDIANWPMFNYYKNQFKWEFYTGAGMGDNTCVRYRSYDNSARRYGVATGDFDDFVTPAFNLAGMSDSLYLNFYTSGASTNASSPKANDSLEVWVSTSGGTKWTKLVGYRGTDIANTGQKASEFAAPASASEWKPRSVSIPAAHRSNNAFFRFRYRPGNTGNNMYLDNISIHPVAAGVSDALKAGSQFNIFPNPATSDFSIAFNTGSTGAVAFSIKDLAGKVIMESNKTFTSGTTEQVQVARSAMPSAGFYFVTVTIDGISSTQKLVVY